jgi:hypothetical protein
MRTNALTDIAALAVQQLEAGAPARLTFGAKAPAWSWTSGLFSGLSTTVDSAVSASMTFSGVRIIPTVTPAAIVAAGGPKPAAVTIDDVTVTLKKYAGYASGSFESLISTSGLNSALASTLIHQCLAAYELDLVAGIVEDTACLTIDAVPSASTILRAQAAVMAGGGTPSIIALNPADYATLATGGTPATITYTAQVQDSVRYLFGSEVIVTSGLESGTALVMDPSAVLAIQHDASPAVLVDPYSGSTTNAIKVVTDLVAGVIVVRPGGVCVIADVTP